MPARSLAAVATIAKGKRALLGSLDFWVQFGRHGVVAAVGLAAGMTIGTTDGTGGGLWFLGALALVVTAATGAAVLLGWRKRSASRREPAARRAVEARVQHLAREDALTGLVNRSLLVERLEQIVDGSRQGDWMVAVLVIDLDDFQGVNDRLGHAAGDLLLRHAAARLLARLRESDVVARMGADEFAVVQTGVEGPNTVASVCERLLEAMAAPFDLCGRQACVGASIGVALHPTDGEDPECLLEHAELALQRARAAGGGTFCFFDQATDAEVHEHRALQHALQGALERGELAVHYQPQFDLAGRRLVGVEALLRWHHPRRGAIPPELFVPLAEDSGLIVPIGGWLLNEACGQVVQWQRTGAPDLHLSVNLSPAQLRHPNLAGLVQEALERTGLPPKNLELEITEHSLIDNTRSTLATLGRLRALGVRIGIDDFGLGHSSLACLRRFRFDAIKIDRSLVSALHADAAAAAIVRAMLALGQDLRMATVAKGVESSEQRAFLTAEGCAIAQGDYFSPSVPAAELASLIRVAAGPAGAACDDDSREIA